VAIDGDHASQLIPLTTTGTSESGPYADLDLHWDKAMPSTEKACETLPPDSILEKLSPRSEVVEALSLDRPAPVVPVKESYV
jgi:hypothetical protein